MGASPLDIPKITHAGLPLFVGFEITNTGDLFHTLSGTQHIPRLIPFIAMANWQCQFNLPFFFITIKIKTILATQDVFCPNAKLIQYIEINLYPPHRKEPPPSKDTNHSLQTSTLNSLSNN